MNKIQLEASYQLAQMDYDANPSPVNKTRLEQAKAAFEGLTAGSEVAKPKTATKATAKRTATEAKVVEVAIAPESEEEEVVEEKKTE